MCAAARLASSSMCNCNPTGFCTLQDYLANAFRCMLLTKEGEAANPLAFAGVCCLLACPAAQHHSWGLPVKVVLCMVVLSGLAGAELLCA